VNDWQDIVAALMFPLAMFIIAGFAMISLLTQSPLR